MRLIDADSLETHEIYEGEWVRVVYADDINYAPTIDAVEVVRCKDCMKYDSHGHRCKHWNHGVVVMDFCSRAERRADDN